MSDNTPKIAELQIDLLTWYEENQRIFPWRKKTISHYRYIITELLLQRTKAENLAKFYPSFIKRFPNWKSLDSIDLKDLTSFLKPYRYYIQTATKLKEVANKMVLRNGFLPKSTVEFENMTFFDPYITNAILLFIYNKPVPLFNTHMSRVLERFFGKINFVDIESFPSSRSLANHFVNHERKKELNWAILDLAALICKPKPKCPLCPVNLKCCYFRSNFYT